MSLLVVQLPPRPRLKGDGLDTAATPAAGAELAYVLTPDGLNITRLGRAAPGLLP